MLRPHGQYGYLVTQDAITTRPRLKHLTAPIPERLQQLFHFITILQGWQKCQPFSFIMSMRKSNGIPEQKAIRQDLILICQIRFYRHLPFAFAHHLRIFILCQLLLLPRPLLKHLQNVELGRQQRNQRFQRSQSQPSKVAKKWQGLQPSSVHPQQD